MNHHALRGALAFAAASSFVALVSCEAIVNGQVPQYTCNGTSPDACPQGMYCKGAGCVACEKVDICDHLDNDCNGVVDDGKLCDGDTDGFTWCGTLDDQGHPQNVDCDDNDPTVHPGTTEVCNGKDDDCDGKIDNGSICPTNQTCFDGQCISNPCNPSSATDCTNKPNQHCDPVSHQCVDDTTVGPGSPCKADAECSPPYFCVKSSIIGATMVPNGATGMCTAPCCSSDDCPTTPAPMVCYQPGNGGRYCVDPTKLGRGSVVGSEKPGAAETTATRCRSGVVANGKCMDTCCNDNNCTNGTSCVFSTFDGHDGFFCQPAPGSGQQGAICTGASDCHDGACVYYNIFYGNCTNECCGSSACSGFGDRCYFVATNAGDYLGLCAASQQGSGGLGAACTSSSGCMSGICYTDTTGQYCSDTCCVDSDCGSGFVCRPAPTFPRCVKKI